MFLALVICQIVFVAASPFHKYPYVFLLDVGNEELEKTNTEQIRLSAPGGSLALRYPAVGNGDTIAHIRVSGIDFGTDLKANIVDGGPGYKYVVLVFMGNQGVPYDAVMTVQTVSDEDIDENQGKVVSSGYNYYKVAENNDSGELTDDNSIDSGQSSVDENVSSENTDDNVDSTNGEITQQSSNVYTYANKDAYYDADSDDDASNEKDIHKQYSETNSDEEVTSDLDGDANDQNNARSESEPSHFSDDYGNEDNEVSDSEKESFSSGDDRGYEKYQSVMPLRMYDGLRIYPQYAVPFALPNSDNSVYSPDDAVDSDHNMVNDDNDRSDSDKYKDSNNNYFDSDDASAIAS